MQTLIAFAAVSSITLFNFYVVQRAIRRKVDDFYDWLEEYDNYVEVHGHIMDDLDELDLQDEKTFAIIQYSPSNIKALV